MNQETSKQSDLWPYPRMVVHRAGGLLAPENTQAAFDTAVRLGCEAIETDVMMTRDNALILSHDEELGRAVDALGSVSDMSLEALLKLDAGIRFGPQWQGQRMMTLEGATRFCRAHHLWMNLEIKPARGFDQQTAQRLAQALLDSCASPELRARNYLISSFSLKALRAFRALDATTPCGWLLEDIPEDWLQMAKELGVKTIHPDHRLVTSAFVRQAHAAGLGIMVYTVDEVDRARELLDLGVDAICTNRPDLLAKVFDAGSIAS